MRCPGRVFALNARAATHFNCGLTRQKFIAFRRPHTYSIVLLAWSRGLKAGQRVEPEHMCECHAYEHKIYVGIARGYRECCGEDL